MASLPSSVPTAIRLPSGDRRGYSYAPGGSFSGCGVPLRSISARSNCLDVVELGPGMNTRDPVLETLNCATPDRPAAFVDLRTPSTMGTGPPVTASCRRSNGTANTTPPSAYTRCPVGRYRPSLPPETSVFRSDDFNDCTTICALSQPSAVATVARVNSSHSPP